MADKILIVDDNPHVLKLLKISLEKAGYQVFTAENGDMGLEKANEIEPDLIISDVMMPQTDGIEFCWMIRENSRIPMVPFIFLTSLKDRDMEIRGFRAGADEYLEKPVDRQVLLEKVETLLQRSRRVKAMDSEKSQKVKGFEGNLEDLTLVEVIQLINLNKRSGTLRVESEEDGLLVFEKGNLFHASCGNIQGEEAVNKLVTFKKGIFRFEPEVVSAEKNITGSTMNVLLEACRLMDEANLKENE